MNYKIAIDASKGGQDVGQQGNGITEKDFNLQMSNYLKERLDDLKIENIVTRNTDRTISDDERVNIITSSFGNDKKVIVVSNALSNDGEGLEVIYALRNNDKLAGKIADEVTEAGGIVSKYYQLRDPKNTQDDYYEIIKDTPNYETIIISYGNPSNQKDAERLRNDYQDYAEAILKAIASYIGVKYVPKEGTNYYVVKKGDSLWKIANEYDTTVNELKKLNNLKSNILNIGQILIIPKTKETTTYVVKKGDSLWKIANEYNTTVNELKELNNLKTNVLQIGQGLEIPTAKKTITYTVKKGDSLWKIANTYKTSVDAIKKLNNLVTDLLQIGQVLKIPQA